MSFNNKNMVMLSVIVFCLFIVSQVCFGESVEGWNAFKEKILSDKDLVVYYDFEGGESDSVENIAKSDSSAGKGAVNKGGIEEKGRWASTKSMMFDDSYIQANSFEPQDGMFSVEAYLKWKGYGSIKGSKGVVNGTIIGNRGYREGWRILIDKRGCVYFVLGTGVQVPQMIAHGNQVPLEKDVWMHLVCTWDGKIMKVYVDGKLAGEAAYSGKYFEYKKPRSLIVGYGKMGVGSFRLLFDEIAIYKRALGQDEVKKHAEYLPLRKLNN